MLTYFDVNDTGSILVLLLLYWVFMNNRWMQTWLLRQAFMWTASLSMPFQHKQRLKRQISLISIPRC